MGRTRRRYRFIAGGSSIRRKFMKVDFSRLDMEKRMETLKGKSLEALKTLTEGTGPGNDF